jgi:CubicO group peptidase (beta-lactamase class C family)
MAQLYGSPDPVSFALSLKRTSTPGEKWNYDSSLPELVAAFIERKAGLGFRQFADKHLFGPLGITNYDWRVSKSGAPLASGGLSMTLPDLAKLGELMLHRGVYGGTRIVSEAWCDVATSQLNEGAPPYGAYWFLNPGGAFMGVGMGGQLLFVSPEKKLVVAVLGSSWKDFSAVPTPFKALSAGLLALV